MNTQAQQICKSVLQFIDSLNISMETLIAYHNGQQLEVEEANSNADTFKVNKKKNNKKNKKQVKESVKEDVKEEQLQEIKQEVQQPVQKIPEIKQNTLPESKKMWADYDDDEKMDYFTEAPKVEVKTPKVEVKAPKVEVKAQEISQSSISFKHIVDKHSNPVKQAIFPPLPKESSESKGWEEATKEKKFYKKQTYVKQVKDDLPVAHNLHDFIEFLREQMKPKVDFVISDEAHCEHTFKGTLCPSIRSCKMIHIQRCTKGTNCVNKLCPFLHKKDMPTKQAEIEFQNTIPEYNNIKPDKKVKA